VRLSEAPSHGKPTILYDADSSGARNYMALAKEIITRDEAASESKDVPNEVTADK